MPFLSALLRNNAPSVLTYQNWAETTTQADIHTRFLKVLKEGDGDGTYHAVDTEEVAYFENTLASITGTSSKSLPDQIRASDVIAYLRACHARESDAINSASSALTILLSTHAAFPFPADESGGLSPSSLLQAVALLTHNCVKLMNTAAWFGKAVTIRKRPAEQRLAFIFSSLAQPQPPPPASVYDVVDAICRCDYPTKRDKAGARKKDIKELEPIAERLLENRAATSSEDQSCNLPKIWLEPLANLVVALGGDGNNTKGNEMLASKDSLNVEDFQVWANEVELLAALDKLLACFLRPM